MKLKEFIKKNGYFLIAEAGCNHEGSLDNAIQMVREASKTKAHAIKFQSFTKDTLFATEEYTKTLSLDKNALDAVDNITFKKEWYKPLIEECKKNNIIFMSTPFSLEAVDDMEHNDVAIYKIASCDIDNLPLLERLAKTKKPIIISTGLALNKDIKGALSILKRNEVALLHCSVQYPTPLEFARLNRIKVLRKIFKKNIIGYSDHTIGIEAPKIAFTLGAKIIEKHFTITPEKKEGDHIISLSPDEMKALSYSLDGIKDMLGDATSLKKEHILSEQEKKELVFAKRAIYLTHNMESGMIVNENDLIALRPNVGISAKDYKSIIGKKLKVNKNAYTALSLKDFEK